MSFMMKDYKVIIFDWDGTLMDSVARIISSMQCAAQKYHLVKPSDNAVKGIIGLSLEKSVARLFPELGDEDSLRVIEEYKEQYRTINSTPTDLFTDAKPALTQLSKAGKVLAVATGKERNGLERVWAVTQTKHFFKDSRCSGEVKSKPDPEMLTTLLTSLNISAEQAVMVGDTGFDLEMANNAGVDCIGVTMGVCTAQELKQYQPLAIVDSLTELAALLS